MTRIILLDIDGVLVQPGGYRAALRATVRRFVGDFEVEEGSLTELEKRGISSEWDMAPLIIAARWNDVLACCPINNLSDDVLIASNQIQEQKIDLPKGLSIPEFDLVVGQYPAETAFHMGYFHHISEGLRKNLLLGTRNVHTSATMRMFQNFTLGSKKFEQTYQLSAEVEAESLLLTEDEAKASPRIVEKLMSPNHHLAAFTSRPSGIPRESKESHIGYAAEAELALELVGMKDIPVMAFGKLEYIATHHGLDPVALVKPAGFHALAAILAAWTGSELSALNATVQWYITGALTADFEKLPKAFEVVVIEDTLGGIHAARSAGQALRSAGFDVHVLPLGLTSGSKEKAEMFTQNKVPFFCDWESLFEQSDSLHLSKHPAG